MEGINDINQEISINYTNTRKLLNRNEMKSIDFHILLHVKS